MGKQERDEFKERLLAVDENVNGEKYSKELQLKTTENMMKNFSTTTKIRRPNPHRKRKRYIPVKLCALMLSAIAALSGVTYAMAKNFKPQENKILNNAISSGETLETLGINGDIQANLQDLQQKMMSGNLTNQEIIQMAPQINNLCFDVSKSKLSNVLGVRQENISFEENFEDGITRPKIVVETPYSKDVYHEESILNKNTFPKEISKEIEDIKAIQKIIQEVQNGNFNRDYVLNKYSTILQHTENLAASPLKLENGKIIVNEKGSQEKDNQEKNNNQNIIGEQATPDQER